MVDLDGSIAAYATRDPSPEIPFWPLLFKNVRLFFLGSDDFPKEAKVAAAKAINRTLENVWKGFKISEVFEIDSIAEAHKAVESGHGKGRIILKI